MANRKKISEETKDKVVELTLSGVSVEDIATRLNIGSSTVYHIRAERKVSSPYHKKGVISRTIPLGVSNGTISVEKEEKEEVEQEPSCDVVLNNKTVELVGCKTGFKYTASLKCKDLSIDTGYSEVFAIDLKDLVSFANELMSMAVEIERMKKNVWTV